MGWSIEVDAATRKRMASRYRTIDGPDLARLTEAGLTWLRTNQQIVNALNVFPVPDGDTGTNMVLTLQSAWDEVSEAIEESVGDVAHSIAHGALMGARGNSGVILSQLWRGFARALADHEKMDADAFVAALVEARRTAYKGVVRPVEGTILTVSKDIANAAIAARENGALSVFEILETVVEEADRSVERTPDLLPVLKDAGVVDSGGKGLFFIFEGMLRAAYRQPLDEAISMVQPLSALALENAAEQVEEGQDWEVVVDFRPRGELDVRGFYARLETMGTSIQLGEGDGIYRMHIHVPDQTQYDPIEYIHKELGTVTKVAIENLVDQMGEQAGEPGYESLQLAKLKPNQIATVVVAPGLGIARVFSSLGAAAIIEGGQTMNPSTKEILAAFEDLPTDKVIILPNNKNILLAARQAAGLTVKSVAVVPSVSVPQGIAAMLAVNPDGDFESIVQAMTNCLEEIRSGAITVATRTVEIDGVQVNEGQVIGLLDGKLATAGDELEETLFEVLKLAMAENYELITLYSGEDLTPIQANQIADRVRERMPGLEVELHDGGQPHYQFILSLE